MGSPTLVFLLLALAVVTVKCNSEVDALYAWRSESVDPYNVLQSWDPTLPSPCTWFHISCDSENRVTRIDLGRAGLEGPIAPHLGNLTNLQYLELFGNNISGSIPREIGKLSHLVSLDLWSNKLSGKIPETLGNLKSLRFLRLNSNKLTGKLPL